jgi:tRNA G18 (ribose-2'-O)-methylase SpoU
MYRKFLNARSPLRLLEKGSDFRVTIPMTAIAALNVSAAAAALLGAVRRQRAAGGE